MPHKTMAIVALLVLVASGAWGGGTTRCTTRWDAGLQVYRTECRDGSRAIATYDAGLKRWTTEVVKPPTAPAMKKGQ